MAPTQAAGVRFVMARSVYFWIGTSVWLALSTAAVVSSLHLRLIDGYWSLVGGAAILVIAAVLILASRSGVEIRGDGTVVIVNGWRKRVTSRADIDEFVISDGVSLLAGGFIGAAEGTFAPDRLGVRWHDGSLTTLGWCFANHDEIRVIRKRLNRSLREGR